MNQNLRTFRISEATGATLAAMLPEAYRTGHPWPLFVNGVMLGDSPVLLFPCPPDEGSLRIDAPRFGHPAAPDMGLVLDAGIDPTKVRTWAYHRTDYITDVTGQHGVIVGSHDLRLPPECRLPSEPTPVPTPEQVVVNDRVADLENDLALVSEMLLAEANERGWCEEYDNFVERFNYRSATAKLVPCERERTYRVRITTTTYESVIVRLTHRTDLDRPDEEIEEEALRLLAMGRGTTDSEREFEIES